MKAIFPDSDSKPDKFTIAVRILGTLMLVFLMFLIFYVIGVVK